MYRELSTLLFNDNKKSDHEKKDSSRKSSSRRDNSKTGSNFGGSKTKKSKSKRTYEFSIEEKPVWTYKITQDTMIGIISRTANFNKKQLLKLNKFAQLPPKKPNSDL